MKYKLLNCLALVAFVFTTASMSTNCMGFFYQPECPVKNID